MILFEEALATVLDAKVALGTEQISLENGMGRVLAEDIFSDMDMPPFNKSAMDGFACKRQDLHNDLQIIETIPAGKNPQKEVEINQCSRIMTGAPIPKGADCVIKVEDTIYLGDEVIHFTAPKTSDNICRKGEDIAENQIVLSAGTEIKAQHIAVLASVGADSFSVYAKPVVGVISTGDELVEPKEKPEIGQIRNSNGAQLIAQLQELGVDGKYFGIARDTIESTREILNNAFAKCDVVLLSGGVSMGEFDFVEQVLQELGVEIKFNALAVQPGKPTVFGARGEQFVYGLPGNPVSSFVQFKLLVTPLLSKMEGKSYNSQEQKLQLGAEFSRKKAERKSVFPIQIGDDNKVYPISYNGSAHIHSYLNANGMISFEIGNRKLQKGDWVNVRPL